MGLSSSFRTWQFLIVCDSPLQDPFYSKPSTAMEGLFFNVNGGYGDHVSAGLFEASVLIAAGTLKE